MGVGHGRGGQGGADGVEDVVDRGVVVGQLVVPGLFGVDVGRVIPVQKRLGVDGRIGLIVVETDDVIVHGARLGHGLGQAGGRGVSLAEDLDVEAVLDADVPVVHRVVAGFAVGFFHPDLLLVLVAVVGDHAEFLAAVLFLRQVVGDPLSQLQVGQLFLVDFFLGVGRRIARGLGGGLLFVLAAVGACGHQERGGRHQGCQER